MTLSRARKQQPAFHFPWKRIYPILIFVVLVTAGIFWVNRAKTTPQFPIKIVKIVGAYHANHEEIQHAVVPLVNHGFFGVEVSEIKEKILQFPWVADVNVRRAWPSEVWVTITEKKPVARWHDGSLLSSHGDLFTVDSTTIPNDLPDFVGSEGDQIEMMQSYQQMNNLLTPLHFKITHLELTPTHVWNLTLDNGIKLTLNHKDFLTHLSHFVKVYPTIIGNRGGDVDYIDLRYSNGLAVRWKGKNLNV